MKLAAVSTLCLLASFALFWTGLGAQMFLTDMGPDGSGLGLSASASTGLGTLRAGPFVDFVGSTAALAWFANPLLFMAWMSWLFRWRLTGSTLAILALIIGATCMNAELVPSGDEGDEFGSMHYAKVIGYGHGYWLWICSILASLAAAVTRRRFPQERARWIKVRAPE